MVHTDPHRVVDELDRTARAVLSDGRPDSLDVDPATVTEGDLAGHPWARLALAAVVIGRNPRDERSEELLARAREEFEARADRQGLGYRAYVRGTRCLALGRYGEAVGLWQDACGILGEETPVGTRSLAHLAVASYHQGDLDAARAFADDALGLARLSVDRRGEGLALVYRGLVDLARGEFPGCLVAVGQADEVFREIGDLAERFEWPIATLLRASVHGFRGEVDDAYAVATEGLGQADEVGVAWYRGIALAVRAEFCVDRDPTQAVADARAAVETLREVGDPWWEACALRALGVASHRSGHPDVGVRLLERARALSPGPMEARRSDLALAELLVQSGRRRDALPLLVAAEELFRVGGARFLQCRALTLLEDVDRRHAGAYRRRRRQARRDDPAYERLVADADDRAPHTLTVTCLGTVEVRVDGRPVSFLTHNAERALLVLLFSREGELHYEELAETLWPDVPADRSRPRIRTVLWQVRRALGDEAWRVGRRGDLVRLDRRDIRVDLDELVDRSRGTIDDATRRHLADALSAPVLAPYQYEPWAEAVVGRARARAEQLRLIPDHRP